MSLNLTGFNEDRKYFNIQCIYHCKNWPRYWILNRILKGSMKLTMAASITYNYFIVFFRFFSTTYHAQNIIIYRS